MKIIHVIPIGKGVPKESLSYFTTLPVEKGMLVSVGIRKKNIPAIVIETEEVDNKKSEIKSLPFGMRKVEKILSPTFFSKAFIKSASECADYFATVTGAIITHLIPEGILQNADIFGTSTKDRKEVEHPRKETLAIQGDEERRLSEYKTLIREEFARKLSVYCCVPTLADAKRYFEFLSHGIESHAFLLHSGIKGKKLQEVWQKIQNTEHPVFIVATGNFFGLPRHDLKTIILEKESSRAYKIAKYPYFDVRTFAEIYAKNQNAQLILGDELLRTETLWRIKNGEIGTLSMIQWKLHTREAETLVDMREKTSSTKEEKKFKIIGSELFNILRDGQSSNLHILLFAARKGYAPSIVCQDCGNHVQCNLCKAPVVLFKNHAKKENIFLCNRCGEKRNAEELCVHCGSWRLLGLGIGIDRVEEELQKILPRDALFVADRERIKTALQAEKLIARFEESRFGILLSTEIILPYIKEKVDHAAVVSIDSLFAIPDFRMNEKIFGILLKIRAQTSGKFLIQTRNPEEKVLMYAKEGNIVDFYRSEIGDREKFNYPPFTTLIKISLSGEKTAVIAHMGKLAELLKKYTPEIFPSFTPEAKGKYHMNALIQIRRDRWPDKELIEQLRALPRHFRVQVDPDTII